MVSHGVNRRSDRREDGRDDRETGETTAGPSPLIRPSSTAWSMRCAAGLERSGLVAVVAGPNDTRRDGSVPLDGKRSRAGVYGHLIAEVEWDAPFLATG